MYQSMLEKQVVIADVSLELVLCFRENDIEDVLEHSFSVEHSSFGQVQEIELKPGGKDMCVTEENKKEYVT